MITLIIGFLVTFAVGLCFAPLVIKLAKKARAGQTILHYVEAHKQKEGTPTLGGLIFLLSSGAIFLFFMNGSSRLALVALAVFFAYGLLGFLDDFIKVRTHKNLGLRAYQKIIGQAGIAILIAVFVWNSPFLGGSIFLPWGLVQVDIGWWIIPLIVIAFIAMTNSANLTDGLDGLAGGVSFVALLTLSAISMITMNYEMNLGASLIYEQEITNLVLLGLCVAGGVLAFLCVNSYPAKIFIGDTGSLALGGVICAVASFCGQVLVLLIVCITFVVSALSVILQVIYFKITKKRIFLMSPLHHHFEKKGVNECKIVAIYIVVTIVASGVAIALCLL